MLRIFPLLYVISTRANRILQFNNIHCNINVPIQKLRVPIPDFSSFNLIFELSLLQFLQTVHRWV